MRAAAAMSAPTAAASFHLFVARHAAQLQRLGDVLIHRLLHLMQILLRFDESDSIRAGLARKAKLGKVVLPSADRAVVERSDLVEDEEATTRAWKCRHRSRG